MAEPTKAQPQVAGREDRPAGETNINSVTPPDDGLIVCVTEDGRPYLIAVRVK